MFDINQEVINEIELIKKKTGIDKANSRKFKEYFLETNKFMNLVSNVNSDKDILDNVIIDAIANHHTGFNSKKIKSVLNIINDVQIKQIINSLLRLFIEYQCSLNIRNSFYQNCVSMIEHNTHNQDPYQIINSYKQELNDLVNKLIRIINNSTKLKSLVNEYSNDKEFSFNIRFYFIGSTYDPIKFINENNLPEVSEFISVIQTSKHNSMTMKQDAIDLVNHYFKKESNKLNSIIQ